MTPRYLQAMIALILILGYLSPQILALNKCAESQKCAGCYDGKCTACMTGFYRSGNTCVNTTKITNCRTYNVDGTCEYCDYGYQGTKLGACMQYCTNFLTSIRDAPGNRCMAVSSITEGTPTISYKGPAGACATRTALRCTLCRKSMPSYRWPSVTVYGAMGTSTTYKSTIDGCDDVQQALYVKNCMYYDESLQCKQCIKGFALTPDHGACVDKTNGVSNCKKYLDMFGDRCAICHDGYYASDVDTCSKVSTVTATV